MTSAVKSVAAFFFENERDVPYLGELRPGDVAGTRGYFVRAGNRTVYPSTDRSVIVRIETRDGVIGWGETYGLVAPFAVVEIIEDLLAGFAVGREPRDAAAIYDDLYGLMRVRGYGGGFYHDALAAVDIALWDITGKLAGVPVAQLIGNGRRDRLPAYVSGLPGADEAARCALAHDWQDRGFDSFKFALPSVDDPVREFALLRGALGPTARIAADLHWAYDPPSALALAEAVAEHDPWFLEAPCPPEDIDGLGAVCTGTPVAVAAGEEWRNVFDLRLRLDRGAPDIFQPEMGHIGITQFVRMVEIAAAAGCSVVPHATIGTGVFLAASLQASAALAAVAAHEFQHTVAETTRGFVTESLDAWSGHYRVPAAPGIGVEPTEELLRKLRTR